MQTCKPIPSRGSGSPSLLQRQRLTLLACCCPQVADLIKSDRLNRLNAVVNRVAEERAQRFAGRDLEVLVEGPNPRDSSQVGVWLVGGGEG